MENGKKFFMPAINDRVKAEDKYQEIKSMNEKEHFAFSDKRVYSISYEFKGLVLENTVGLECRENREVVIAIFESEYGLFYTVTKTRGLYRPDPLITNKRNVKNVIYFLDEISANSIR